MRKKILLYLLIVLPFTGYTQMYENRILQYREGYKMILLKGDHALKPTDTSYLRFYEPDSSYRVKATFEAVTNIPPFQLKTINGGHGPVVSEFGIVYFNMDGAVITLHVFRLMTKPEFRMLARTIDSSNYDAIFFIPFYDNTNYKRTFGGGRYLDITGSSLVDGTLILDFNKACNPHAAYERGYPYIVAPLLQEDYSPGDAIERNLNPTIEDIDITTKKLLNTIRIDIEAGEKKFDRRAGK